VKKVILHPDAVRDFKGIMLLDDLSAKRIFAVFEQAKRDPNFFSLFRRNAYRDVTDHRIDVKQWKRMQRLGNDVWRIRFPDLELRGKTYRVVYAFRKPATAIHVLAIVPRREVDYDSPNHPFARRIERALASIQPQ
jgi:mRNA-degrading endonuclease RelE of RelBE toxin-antitoxin system